MQVEKIDKLVENKTLDEIIEIRDKYDMDSEEWDYINMKKAILLEEMKPSTQEHIIYFDSDEIEDIPNGFTPTNKLPLLKHMVSRRSLLEYNPSQRHPIPYVIIKHGKRYFLILREKGSGELRLIGLMGLVGGHIGEVDIDELSLNKTIINGLKRELQEEAGIEDGMVKSIDMRGLIKLDEGVDRDHLGIVYEIELLTDEIKAEEDGVLKGMWLHKNQLKDYYDHFESWAKIVYEYLLKE